MTRIIRMTVPAVLLGLMLISPASARVQDDFRGFSQPELDQLLAPVALYPDTVLSHVLIAATYPLEVVQAARWTRQHNELRGEAAVDAVVGRPWDPSVMALVAFPELLDRMDADLDWTQQLGDAFLFQEEAVLGSIQRLRGQAYQAGHLGSNQHVRVIREREVIYIEPVRRQVIYLPRYEPTIVYGRWHWADYPPVVWYHPRRHRPSVVLSWSLGYRVAPTFFFSSFHWSRRQVVVVNHHHHYYRPNHYSRPRAVSNHSFYSGRDISRHKGARRWQHQAEHRRGVAYRHALPERHRQSSATLRDRPGAQRSETRERLSRTVDTRSRQRQWADSTRSKLARTSARSADPARLSRVNELSQSRQAQTARREFSTARRQANDRSQLGRSSAKSAPVTRSRERGLVRSSSSAPSSRPQTRAPRESSARVVRQRSSEPALTRSRSTARAATAQPRQPSRSTVVESARRSSASQSRPVRPPRAANPAQGSVRTERSAADSRIRSQRAAPERRVSDRSAARRRE